MAAHPLGAFCLVLHHHLPYVRHPEHPRSLEERWLFEAITESYLPLIRAWRSLERDGIPAQVTVSLSPTLIFMLQDDLLRERYAQFFKELRELAARELQRTATRRAEHAIARFYAERLDHLWALYEQLDGDLVNEYKRLQQAGRLEVITSSATHAFLPLMMNDRASARAQIQLAAQQYEQIFGRKTSGIWLAECGFAPGIDEFLAEAQIRYFFTDAHGLLNASSAPVYGVYAPLACKGTGVAAFGRDLASSEQVWSAQTGYPGDPQYREFYRDIGFDLPLKDLEPCVPPDGVRVATGLKYHRVTGPTNDKDWYDPDAARAKAAEHARHFVKSRRQQLAHLAGMMDRMPLIVAPYDAELFGHWWFEGPDFIEFLIREAAKSPQADDEAEVRLCTPSQYLSAYPILQSSTPALSSWGEGGFAQYWCNETNEWIYRYLHTAAQQLSSLGERALKSPRLSLVEAALNQAARELILAQSSDFAFMMRAGTTVKYAVQRTEDHLAAFKQLCDGAEACLNGADPNDHFVQKRQSQWNLFPQLDFRLFCESRL